MAVPGNSSKNFNQSGVEGWHTRMLCLNSGAPETTSFPLNLLNYCTPGTANGFLTKGDNIFPVGYWLESEGRVIRIKGCFLYTGDGSTTPLNIRAIFSNVSGTERIQAYPNDSNGHLFAYEEYRGGVPIYFEFNLSHSVTGYFSWAGYYKYEWDAYNTGGGNNKISFVPVVKTTTAWGGSLASDQTLVEVLIEEGEGILLQYITIEELG